MKPYVCNVGKKNKIDAKRTIPLMQHMIINKIMTNVTKKNQYSNKIGVKRNVLIVPRSCINSKLIRSHRQLHTVHILYPTRTHPFLQIRWFIHVGLYSFISIFMTTHIHLRNKQFVSVFKWSMTDMELLSFDKSN